MFLEFLFSLKPFLSIFRFHEAISGFLGIHEAFFWVSHVPRSIIFEFLRIHEAILRFHGFFVKQIVGFQRFRQNKF